jgi:hypothetical protein
MINWNGHDPEKTAVHCSTEELAEEVLKIAKNAGLTWRSGEDLETKNFWSRHAKETCYDLLHGVSYGYKGFYVSEGYHILPAEEFISWNKPVPEDTSVEIGTGNDPVNHPSHYTAGKVECIDALEAATVNLTGIEAVCTANAIKYLWRWKQKNGVEDLKKAKWYIDRLIDRDLTNKQ